MSILSVMARNFSRKARSLRPEDLAPLPTGFRGMIRQDPALCTGCRDCEYVCAPKAIGFDETKSDVLSWEFFAGQCSYCGLCEQYCPTGAITNSGEPPPVTGDQDRLRVSNAVPYQACVDCGRTMIPIPEPVMERLLGGGPLTETAAHQRLQCDSCRRRSAGQNMRDAFMKGRAS